MKVLGIFLFILSLTIGLTLLMDILLGFTLSKALANLLNPFWVIETGEIVMFGFFILLTICQQIFFIIKNKANRKADSN